MAYHLHPSRQSTLALAGPTLLGKLEHFTVSMYQKVYRSAAQLVKNLNVVTLLTAYQAELFQEMGHLWLHHGPGRGGGEIAVAKSLQPAGPR